MIPVGGDGSSGGSDAAPNSTGGSSAGGNSNDPNGLTDDRYAVKQPNPGGAGDPTSTTEGASGGASTVAGGSPRPPGARPQSVQDVKRQPDGSPEPGEISAGDDAEAELDELARAAAVGEEPKLGEYRKQRKSRGKNWAIASGRPGTIPIRRSIQIAVRDDAVIILPEASPTNEASAAGQEFKFGNAPDEAYEDLISAVEQRIRNWGIAGEGLYWRPVVELKIGPESDQRVNELMRYLKFSGVEIHHDAVAQQVEGSAGSASR